MKKSTKTTAQKKEAVQKRINKLDPNNNINNKENPLVKHGDNVVRDDGFEHRTSDETTEEI